jgi:hypothetical protein
LFIFSGLDTQARLRLDDRTLAAMTKPDVLLCDMDDSTPNLFASREPAVLL